MSDGRARFSQGPNVPARKSILTGKEFLQALNHLGVSKRTFAKHTGLNEVTVSRFSKRDDDIPLWAEWMLWTYYQIPWTRRIRGRHNLPLRLWGISRDDPDPEAEGYDEVVSRTVSRKYGWTRASMVRRLERGMHDILNDPDASERSKGIAKRAIQDIKRSAAAINYDISEGTRALKDGDNEHHDGADSGR